MNSLQTSLPIFHDEAVNQRGHSYAFLVRAMAAAPAQTFGLPKKGRLAVGADADFVVFDPTESYTITADDNASRADYSIYEGREVTGRVKQTYLRGTSSQTSRVSSSTGATENSANGRSRSGVHKRATYER